MKYLHCHNGDPLPALGGFITDNSMKHIQFQPEMGEYVHDLFIKAGPLHHKWRCCIDGRFSLFYPVT